MVRILLLVTIALSAAKSAEAGGSGKRYCGSMPSYLYSNGEDDGIRESQWCDYYLRKDAEAKRLKDASSRPGSGQQAFPPTPVPDPRRVHSNPVANKNPATKKDKPEEKAPPGPPGACLADEQRNKTNAEFEKGIAAMKKEAAAIEASARRVSDLVKRIRNDVVKCEPMFGEQVAAAIDQKDDGKTLNDKIQDLGSKTKAAGSKMAAVLENAKKKYKELDFCSVNSCSGSFTALGNLFTPVSKEARASLEVLGDLRRKYILPSKATLDKRRADIEMVLSGAACAQSRRDYQEAMNHWTKIQQNFGSLEQRIQRQNATADAVAKGAKRAGNCSVAKK